MRTLRNIFGKRWKLHRAALVESTEELRNPGRGWYQIYTFQAGCKFSRDDVEWCLNQEDVLALVLIDIGEYREQALDEVCLTNIENILKCFVDLQLDMILRIVYDHEGRAQEKEPFYFTQVMEHMDQLGPLLKKYADNIYVYQGMLVGNWGEMHTSRFLATDKLALLSKMLRKHLGEEPFQAVRRPMYWRALHPSVCGNKDFSGTRIGLFDDAIFGSKTHMGTFGSKPEAEMGWDDPWAVEEEIAFEEKLCQYVPQGGEAVYEAEMAEELSLQDMITRLARMHVSYLNRDHDKRLLEMWKNMTWKGSGPWLDVSGIDFIGRHLGYRFCVRNVTTVFSWDDEDALCRWEIAIENTGFARCYQNAEVWIEWSGEHGKVCTAQVELELSHILPGETKTGTCTTTPSVGNVYLYAQRAKDKAAIYFANETEGRRGVRLGRLDQ